MSCLFFKRPTCATTPTTNTTTTHPTIAQEDELKSAVNQPLHVTTTNSAVISGATARAKGTDTVHVVSGDTICRGKTHTTVPDTVACRANEGETDHENKVALQGKSIVLTPSPPRAPFSAESSSELLGSTSAGPCRSIPCVHSLPILKGVENKSRVNGDQIRMDTARKERLQELFRAGQRALVLASGMPHPPPPPHNNHNNNSEEAALPSLDDDDKGAVIRGALTHEPKRQGHTNVTVTQGFDRSNNNGLSSSSTMSSFNQQYLPKDQQHPKDEDNRRRCQSQEESRGDAHPTNPHQCNGTPSCVVIYDNADTDEDDISDYMTMARANRLGNVKMSNNNSSGSSQLVLSPSPPTSVIRENPQMISNNEVDAAGSERDSVALHVPSGGSVTNNCLYRHVPYKRSLLDALLQPDGRHSAQGPSSVGFDDNGGVGRERTSGNAAVRRAEGAESFISRRDVTKTKMVGACGHGKSLLEQIAFRNEHSLSEEEDGNADDDVVGEKGLLRLGAFHAHPLADESPLIHVDTEGCSPMHVRRSLSLQPPVEYPPPPPNVGGGTRNSNVWHCPSPSPLPARGIMQRTLPSASRAARRLKEVVRVREEKEGPSSVGIPITTTIDLSDDDDDEEDAFGYEERKEGPQRKESAVHASSREEHDVTIKARGAVSLSLSSSPFHGVTTARHHGTAVCMCTEQKQQPSEMLRFANRSGVGVKEGFHPPAARRLIDVFSPPHTCVHVQYHKDTSCTAKDYKRPHEINFDDI